MVDLRAGRFAHSRLGAIGHAQAGGLHHGEIVGAIPDRGGRTARANFLLWMRDLERRFPDHDPQLVARLASLYGTEAEALLARGLGRRLPSGLFEAEAAHLAAHEFARTEEDMLWRRTKLALAGERHPAPGRAPAA